MSSRKLDRIICDPSTVLGIRNSYHAILRAINLVGKVRLVQVKLNRELTGPEQRDGLYRCAHNRRRPPSG